MSYFNGQNVVFQWSESSILMVRMLYFNAKNVVF